MREKLFKYSIISLVIINFWTLYGFFDYFLDKSDSFRGFGLLIFYVWSIYISIGLGFIILIIRLIYHLKFKRNILNTNLLYIFCGIFNLNLFIIWIITVCLKISILDTIFSCYALCSLVISAIIFYDIYKTDKYSIPY